MSLSNSENTQHLIYILDAQCKPGASNENLLKNPNHFLWDQGPKPVGICFSHFHHLFPTTIESHSQLKFICRGGSQKIVLGLRHSNSDFRIVSTPFGSAKELDNGMVFGLRKIYAFGVLHLGNETQGSNCTLTWLKISSLFSLPYRDLLNICKCIALKSLLTNTCNLSSS